jgi:hypothetical protein
MQLALKSKVLSYFCDDCVSDTSLKQIFWSVFNFLPTCIVTPLAITQTRQCKPLHRFRKILFTGYFRFDKTFLKCLVLV